MEDKPASKILIIEDDPLVLRGFETILKQEGYLVTTLNSGETALEIINKENFDLILTDLNLEGMNGIDILKRVKKISPDIPVIVITGYESMDSAISALRGGAYDYLIKPCQDIDLKTTIKRGLEKRMLEKELLILATTDPLTKLYNRNYFLSRFEEEFNKALRYKMNIACILIDIDHFKKVNDNYGHQIGDRILIELSDLLRINSRNIDIIGRYGGEEFILILPQINDKSAYQLCERLRKITSENVFSIQGNQIKITISLGISAFPNNKVKNYKELIRLADNALYEAKRTGRNKTVISDEKNGKNE
jgi:two-component system cell cycle response regulator